MHAVRGSRDRRGLWERKSVNGAGGGSYQLCWMSQSSLLQGIMLRHIFRGTAFQSQGPDEDSKELGSFPIGPSSNRSCQPLFRVSVPFPVEDAMVKDRSVPGRESLIRESFRSGVLFRTKLPESPLLGQVIAMCSPASNLHLCGLWTRRKGAENSQSLESP